MVVTGKGLWLPALVASLAVGSALAGCCDEQERLVAELTGLNKAAHAENDALRKQIADLGSLQGELDTLKAQLHSSERQLDQNKAAADLAREQQETLKGLMDGLKKMIESGDLEVRIRRGRMVIALPSEVLFASGEAELSEKGQETLASVVQAFKGIKERDFQVAGHTDNVPLGKDNPHASNWHLSAARAVAVVQLMVKKGMSPKRLSAAGYAHYQPAASNKTAKGKAQNRRIEITLMPNLKELPDLSELEEAFGLKEPPPPDEGY